MLTLLILLPDANVKTHFYAQTSLNFMPFVKDILRDGATKIDFCVLHQFL